MAQLKPPTPDVSSGLDFGVRSSSLMLDSMLGEEHTLKKKGGGL